MGIRRSHNQDSYGIARAANDAIFTSRGHFFIVADGMGAHAVGEMASKLAVDTIQHLYAKTFQGDPAATLSHAFREANRTIHQRGKQNQDFKGMGTTATALVIRPDGAYLGHVGDSRCYRIRSGTIEQLSFDHSLQWETARKRNVPPNQVTDIPSNILSRCLGTEPKVRVDVTGPVAVVPNDRFLLCSDGLSGLVGEKEIWSVVTHLPGEEACRFLVDLANLRGGPDNITCILVEVEGEATPLVGRGLKIHWPTLMLVTGVLAVLAAFFLAYFSLPGSAQTGLVGASLLIGSVCMFLAGRETHEDPTQDPESQVILLATIRQCTLEKSLVENLHRASLRMQDLARKEKWPVEWDHHAIRAAAAEKAVAAGDLDAAFPELCRAISIMSAGLATIRNKQEVIQPKWQTEGKR